ncbi:MAG: right-handed parallel beta-helix repeat-containing protein [Rhodobacterales bacterium]|nr:right-handed parallel beta-helix repeat-containing protein [Rhodobacterales bacterium]
MNKAITDGLVLMPQPFSAGLNLWSQTDGTPGSASWAGQPDAVLVSSDADFGDCLEMQKTDATQSLRAYAETPFEPGLYLRVTARVKAVSGNLPGVRIAGWPGNASGGLVSGVPQTGPEVVLDSYGKVVTVSAIFGSGNRQGVDVVWGTAPVFGHFGLDLTGPTGGVVRIDDLVIEDVTEVFHRKMMDWVDVRDYGAVGDGVTDDSAAMAAADAAAAGRTVLVSAGDYWCAQDVTFASPVRFEGTLAMPANRKLACTRNYDLDTYAAAFGSELEGFRRGLQVLFHFTDHVVFDLNGRRVDLVEPIDVAALCGLTSFAQRRVITNGQLNAATSDAWTTFSTSSAATYSTASATQLTGVANAVNIPVGSLITGTGVGREVYVLGRNTGAQTLTISQPLWAAAGTRNLGFQRFRYMLDFSGFDDLQKFEITDIEFQCNGLASAILLAPSGNTFRVADCVFTKPRDRGITSIGSGCQGMLVDQCQFVSNEQALRAQDRTSIALNVNANDSKIRDNRIVRFAHFAILNGTGHMFIGNHFFQGDDEPAGTRRAGLVFTQPNLKTLITGNYIDNCFIELSNEHDATPDFADVYSFGGLTVTGNIFTCNDVGSWFRWIVVTPRGTGHFINGLSVISNAFRTVNTNIDRIEAIDTTHATLDFGRFRNIRFEGNTFNGIEQVTVSPVLVEHDQTTEADTWVIDGAGFLPFGARARNVEAVVMGGPVTTVGNVKRYEFPYVLTEQGTGAQLVHLKWSEPLKGTAFLTIRCDSPA